MSPCNANYEIHEEEYEVSYREIGYATKPKPTYSPRYDRRRLKNPVVCSGIRRRRDKRNGL